MAKRKKTPSAPTTNKPSSLIEILQSFGIIVKTKVNFHDRRKVQSLEQQFTEHYMNESLLILDEPNEDHFEEINHQIVNGNLYSVGYRKNQFFVNIKKSKLLIRFKCDFDHSGLFDKVDDFFSDKSTEMVKKEMFYSIVNSERKNTNVMHIEFDLKFDSFVEIVKYLNISESRIGDFMLENEILSRLVEILDVDQEKKQVYIKLKAFGIDATANVSSYYLMGKIDGSQSCFMLDLSYYMDRNPNLSTIDSIYRFFTPIHIKNRIYDKGTPSTFHDCKNIGIYRVLIGYFFCAMTDSDAGKHVKRNNIHPYDIT
ncbi:predicted protein [Naegleria gruberi]|uniref:Predicted protein n=1 Tax=Naegleria gruberi TaxID=5762 RepID=D2VK31_NAEGR|nr:uncharacterized protein NAEGRDRAFT_69251 [Naegleria gruberi]EFC42790.1 predicted protein [Naegleria gruberi]|eukprot:XP_002675534.1 predicted protein [Naegleria gruberi strain NEG-M]